MEKGSGRSRPLPFLFGGPFIRPSVGRQVACGLSLPHLSRHPSMALRSGTLLEFSRPRSCDRGASVSSSFPSPDAGRGPRRSGERSLLAAGHLRFRFRKLVCEIRFKSDAPWTRALATDRPPRFEFSSMKPPSRGVIKESELGSDASLRLEPADKRNRIRR